MPFGQRLEIRVHAGFIARLGFAQRVEQQVGDFRHRRHYDGYRALGVLFRGEARGRLNPFGGAHAGAPELHHEKMTATQ